MRDFAECFSESAGRNGKIIVRLDALIGKVGAISWFAVITSSILNEERYVSTLLVIFLWRCTVT